uniref:Putative secreted protein n=1 Tax=Anopheles darlingi TaxID=43151 RepID=A0A2M4DQ76_ANODA
MVLHSASVVLATVALFQQLVSARNLERKPGPKTAHFPTKCTTICIGSAGVFQPTAGWWWCGVCIMQPVQHP